jgi:hypothetical protein
MWMILRVVRPVEVDGEADVKSDVKEILQMA